MLFVPVIRRSPFGSSFGAKFGPSLRNLDRFFQEPPAAAASEAKTDPAAAGDQPYELSFDVPGVTREQLTIGIEGSVIRIETLPEARRQYKAAYELPQDIDVAKSEARLENGVLTLKLVKVQAQSKAVRLTVN